MVLHSRDAITVFAAVATRPRADCSSMEDHTSLSTALVPNVALHYAVDPLQFRHCDDGCADVFPSPA